MKKSNLRSVLMIFVVALSFGSYVFLNSVAVEETVKPEGVLEMHEEHYQDHQSTLPDATIIIKIVEKAKDLFPAT